MVEKIALEHELRLRVAQLYSEQDPESLIARPTAGRIAPLESAGPLVPATLGRCKHIVGLMGTSHGHRI